MEAACGSAASWHLACKSKKKKGRSDGVDEEEAHAVLCSPKTDIFLMTWTSLCVRMLHSSPRWYLSYYCIWVIQLNICFFFFFSWKIISRCCLSTATFYLQKPQRHSYHADEERFHLLHSKKSFQLHIQRCLLLSIKLHFSFIWFVQFDTFSLLMLLYRYFQAQ